MNFIKFILPAVSLFLSLEAAAIEIPQLTKEWKVIAQISPKNTPKYFFRPVPESSFLTYTTTYANYLLDMESGKEIQVPHWVDAISEPTGKVITIPRLLPNTGMFPRFGFIPEFGLMEFYRLKDLLSGVKKPFYTDPQLSGAYQTIGLLQKNAQYAHIRIVTESFLNKGRVLLQEYKMFYDQFGEISKIEKVYDHSRQFCPELTISLPMISKNGKLFSAVDPESRHMKIYSIGDDLSCELIKDLAMLTGKVDFSYDNRFIAFHVSKVRPLDVAYVVKEQNRDNDIDIMLYDLQDASFKWVSKCEKSNCYYPGFLPSGEIVFIQQAEDSNEYSFVKIGRVK